MATVTVFVCPDSQTQVTQLGALSTRYAGTCSAGQGSWQSVTLAEPWDPTTLNSSELAAAFGAGFVVCGTGLAIAWAARFFITAIRSAF